MHLYKITSNKKEFSFEAKTRREAAEKFYESEDFNNPKHFTVKAPYGELGQTSAKFYTSELKVSMKNKLRSKSKSEVSNAKQNAGSTVQTAAKQNLESNNENGGEISRLEKRITENINTLTESVDKLQSDFKNQQDNFTLSTSYNFEFWAQGFSAL